MGLQAMIDAMGDSASRERSNYHLTYGDLIDALRAAPADAMFDKQVVGLGSYRGYYIDIALYTESQGVSASTSDDIYECWRPEYRSDIKELQRKTHELADTLDGLLGKYLTGYKGGQFEVTREKPLWLATDSGNCSGLAVVGIGGDLKLITKLVG